MAERLAFRRGSVELGILRSWWRELRPREEELSLELQPSKRSGARAALRRARGPDDVVLVPYFHDLLGRLREDGRHPSRNEQGRLLLVAGLAAHVERDAHEKPLPLQLATPGEKATTPRLSEGRFRRLLAIGDEDDARLYEALRRILPLLGGVANLQGLAAAAMRWNRETRRDWAYGYYGELAERRDR